MRAIAKNENVWCKISGMVTEADWHNWVLADFEPYLDVVFEAFGAKRVMFGSDWPVCLLAASYEEVYALASSYLARFSEKEQELFWKGNAEQFYKLY